MNLRKRKPLQNVVRCMEEEESKSMSTFYVGDSFDTIRQRSSDLYTIINYTCIERMCMCMTGCNLLRKHSQVFAPNF